MHSTQIHLRVIITLFIILGLSIIGYQVFVLKTPLTASEVDDLWTIDAKVSFEVRGTKPIVIQLYIPPKEGHYDIAEELFLANGYGENIKNNPPNRLVTWSARFISGQQTVFYRLNLTKRFAANPVDETKGDLWRDPIKVEGQELDAVESLVKEARSKSVNIATFITSTINLVNDPNNGDAKLLLNKDDSVLNKVRVIELVLSHARISIQHAHTLTLTKSTSQTPELWIRSYIEPSKPMPNQNGQENDFAGSWNYFNPSTGEVGLPDDRMIWWVGTDPVVRVQNGSNVKVDFSLDQNVLTAIELSRLTSGGNQMTGFSFYTLPIATQLAYQVMLMIPFGVLVIMVLRNIVGVNTLGTFTPVLIALAFQETGLIFGIIFFTIIVFFGLLLRSYLEYLKLQMLPRLSVVLTFVVVLIVCVGLLSHKLGFEKGVSISLFPMVILTMTIERLSITWEERGENFALKVAFFTLITASIAYAVMGFAPLIYFVFTFPAVLLLLIAFMLIMGRYRGYRLLELIRFKAMLK